jgi:hypothetical protein
MKKLASLLAHAVSRHGRLLAGMAFRNTGIGLFAIAMSLATCPQMPGQPVLNITSQPADQIVALGSTVTFTVSAAGTIPLTFQWRFNGIDLYRADTASIVLPNAQWSNAGSYSAVVSNPAGSVTSRIALLTFPVHGFERITANPDRTVSLNLTGSVTTTFAPYYDLYPLDASTNLADWSRLTMLLRTNSSSNALSYLDRDGTNLEKRFYRTHTNALITPLPKPSGPYSVGTFSRLMTDPSRSNRYNISTNSFFMVTFWYPAEAKAGRGAPGDFR